MPTGYQIVEPSKPHCLTFQVMCRINEFTYGRTNWQAVKDGEFDYEIPKGSLSVVGSGMFSRYTPAMKVMNNAFIRHKGSSYDPQAMG